MASGYLKIITRRAAILILFSLCFCYIVLYFQWASILQTLLGTSLAWLLGAGTATIMCYWILRTYRLHILLKTMDVHVGFSKLYVITAIAMALSIITPLQSGEILKVELLKRSGALERSIGYAIFMAEKILDLMVVLVLAIFSIFFGIEKILSSKILIGASAALLVGLVIIVGIAGHLPGSNSVSRFFLPVRQCMESKKVSLALILLTISGWLVIAMGWYACLRSISVLVTPLQSVALVSVITIINIMSLVPGAVGVSEVSVAAFLVHLHHSTAAAQAGAVILRIYGLLALLIGMFHYLWLEKKTGLHHAVGKKD